MEERVEERIEGTEEERTEEHLRFADFALEDRPQGFQESLDRLDGMLDHIPRGWQDIYYRCVRTLRGMNCPSRAHVQLSRPTTAYGVLEVRQLTQEGVQEGAPVTAGQSADPVVQGILRKLTARSLCTCERCGRSASWRATTVVRAGGEQSFMRSGTFCAHCRMPVELQRELSLWLARMTYDKEFQREHPVIPLHDLRPCLRALIPPLYVKSLPGPRGVCQIDYLLAQDLLNEKPKWREIKNYLDERLWRERQD